MTKRGIRMKGTVRVIKEEIKGTMNKIYGKTNGGKERRKKRRRKERMEKVK